MALPAAVIGAIDGGMLIYLEFVLYPTSPSYYRSYTWVDGAIGGAWFLAAVASLGATVAFAIVGANACLITAPLEVFKASLCLASKVALITALAGAVLGIVNNLLWVYFFNEYLKMPYLGNAIGIALGFALGSTYGAIRGGRREIRRQRGGD